MELARDLERVKSEVQKRSVTQASSLKLLIIGPGFGGGAEAP